MREGGSGGGGGRKKKRTQWYVQYSADFQDRHPERPPVAPQVAVAFTNHIVANDEVRRRRATRPSRAPPQQKAPKPGGDAGPLKGRSDTPPGPDRIGATRAADSGRR